VMVTAAPIVGQTARFLYLYPWAAANQHVCWTLVTARQPTAFALPIPGMPSIGLCRIDPLNQLFAPSTSLNGSGILSTTIPVPANPAFAGFQFDVQYVDLDLATLALRWSDNDAQMTTALSPTPVASFTATPTSGVAPMLVQFTDTSANIPTSWQWDFDNDGVVDSTVQNPAWTYTQNGVYSVRLVASNASGSSTVTRNSLVVAYDPNQPNPLLHMIPIAPGVFQMGSAAGQANEQPVHQVTLTMPFWMCRHEVTQAEYQTLMGSNPSSFTGPSAPNAPQRPVEMVSWSDAVAYCQALTAIEQAAGRVPVGYRYRLPTEAEWEYCCRAGTTTEWHVGMSLSTSEANFGGALANTAYPNGQTTAVESYAPNAFGLRDMHGNVSEWCLDAYSSYTPGPATNPYVPYVPGSSYNVTRGGGWLHFAFGNRSACRYTVTGPVTTFAFPDVGFRIVLAPALGP
jgi:formylglycine-generating enzyme required for sulfatase activity